MQSQQSGKRTPTFGGHHRLDDSSDSESENEEYEQQHGLNDGEGQGEPKDKDSLGTTSAKKKKKILTVAKASDHCGEKNYRLIIKNEGYGKVEDLSRLKELDYVDMSYNKLKEVSGISALNRLKTLNISNNKINNINCILKLPNIQILNISNNPISNLEWLSYSSFKHNLIALIASHINLSGVNGVNNTNLPSIKTLILSNNQIDHMDCFYSLPSIVKINLSNNLISNVSFQKLSKLSNLKELRLSHNKIRQLNTSTDDKFWTWNTLKILDIGHNSITNIQDLANCAVLQSLNVSGNPCVDQLSNDEIMQHVKKYCKHIEIIDSVRIAGGKRKNRINRLRKAVGMDVEKDRKFARPPPIHTVKQMLQRSSEREDQEEGKGKQQVHQSHLIDDDTKAEAMKLLKRAEGQADNENEKEKELEKENSKKDGESPETHKTEDVKQDVEQKSKDEEEEEEEEEEEKEKEKKVRKKRKLEIEMDEAEEDKALDADAFVKRAKENVTAKSMGGVRVKEVKSGKKKRKRERSENKGKPKAKQSFGQGGDSQW